MQIICVIIIYGGEPWLFAGTDLYSEGKTGEPIELSHNTQ
jgi:hypothetical protein